MGIGVSIFLVAVGAILAFAVEMETEGIDLNTVGTILMIVGVIGALFSMMFWSTWGGWNNRRDDIVVERDRPRTTTYVERERPV